MNAPLQFAGLIESPIMSERRAVYVLTKPFNGFGANRIFSEKELTCCGMDIPSEAKGAAISRLHTVNNVECDELLPKTATE